MQERWYQSEAVSETMALLVEKPEAHPLIVMPTGSGKSHTLCRFIDSYLTAAPIKKVLVISHVREILEQDHKALEDYFEIDIGLYSAGLGSKTIKKITVAGIQSIYSKSELFVDFDLIIIDECHLIPTKGEGMYRTFLSEMSWCTYVGLTATNFRLGHGYIHEGDGALFTDISYNLSDFEKFNRLVDEGYLSKLITKKTEEEWDTSGIKKTGGDFNLKALSEAFGREEITKAAIDEVLRYGKKFKLWLLFAIDIEHAEYISKILNFNGVKTACVHSKMENRDEVMRDIKAGVYRAVVNVDILTTGFDAPQIDLIVLLRPTESQVLHVQMIGRGLRVVYAPGFDLDTIEGRLAAIEAGPKQFCFVMDFAGNTAKLGPINDVKVIQKGKNGTGEAVIKTCPNCDSICHPSAKFCDGCGHEFIFKEKISMTASNQDVVKKEHELEEWLDVKSVSYSIHSKKGSPSSLRVTYNTGLVSFSEWVCYDHSGYAKRTANNWVKWRWLGHRDKLPSDLKALYANVDILRKPKSILVKNSGKFPSIEDAKF